MNIIHRLHGYMYNLWIRGFFSAMSFDVYQMKQLVTILSDMFQIYISTNLFFSDDFHILYRMHCVNTYICVCEDKPFFIL